MDYSIYSDIFLPFCLKSFLRNMVSTTVSIERFSAIFVRQFSSVCSRNMVSSIKSEILRYFYIQQVSSVCSRNMASNIDSKIFHKVFCQKFSSVCITGILRRVNLFPFIDGKLSCFIGKLC